MRCLDLACSTGPEFLRQARAAGYDGIVSVEHEDAEFGWPGMSLDLRKDGELRALAYLRQTLAAL